MALSEARGLNMPPLSALAKEGGKEECYKFIKVIIIYMNQFYAATWNDLQIKECANILYEKYYYWLISDWYLFRNRCMSGRYNNNRNTKIYGTFSPSVLIQWAEIYDSEWISYSAEISINEHKLIIDAAKTNESNGVQMPDFVKDKIKEIEAKRIEQNKLNDLEMTQQKTIILKIAKFNELKQKCMNREITEQEALDDYFKYIDEIK